MPPPSTSTIHSVRVALRELLQERPALRNVRISYGPPLPSPPAEFIMLADAESDDEQAAALGQLRRQEDYRLNVVVYVFRNGHDMEAAAERAYVLTAEIEETLREAPTLDPHYPPGAGQLLSAEFYGVRRDELRGDDKSREARIYCEIRVRARI